MSTRPPEICVPSVRWMSHGRRNGVCKDCGHYTCQVEGSLNMGHRFCSKYLLKHRTLCPMRLSNKSLMNRERQLYTRHRRVSPPCGEEPILFASKARPGSVGAPVSILLVQDIFGRFLRRCPQDLATVDKITHGGEWYQQLAAAVKSMNGTEHSAPSNREPGDVAQDKDLDFDLRHKNAEMQTDYWYFRLTS